MSSSVVAHALNAMNAMKVNFFYVVNMSFFVAQNVAFREAMKTIAKHNGAYILPLYNNLGDKLFE